MIALLRWLILLAFTVLLVCLAVVNRNMVSLSLYPLPYEIELPLYLFCVVFFLFGVFATGILGSLKRISRKHELRQAKKRVVALENELAGLRGNNASSE